MDAELSELAKAASQFGLGGIVEDIEARVDDFVGRGIDWARKSQEIWQRTGLTDWTPIQTGNLAASVDTEVAMPYIRVGVIQSKAPYSEAKNVGTKTGYGPDFIDAVWFTYAEHFGNKLFPGEIKVWRKA